MAGKPPTLFDRFRAEPPLVRGLYIIIAFIAAQVLFFGGWRLFQFWESVRP